MASTVLLASGSMTAAVDRLERQGWVVRKTSPEDRRARILELTSEGKQLIKAAFKEHARDLEDAINVLGESERAQIYRPLKKLGRFAAESLGNQKGNCE